MNQFPLFLSLLSVFAVGVQAEEQKKNEIPKAAADGWISLFNGKDLAGWQGIEGYWSVVEGAIQCSETKEKSRQTNLILLSSKDYPEKFANFELRYRWKWITAEGNSGVQVRGRIDYPEGLHVGGYQADIDAGNQYTGIIYDEGSVVGGRGIMSNVGEKTLWDADNKRTNTPLEKNAAEIKKIIKPIGEWNEGVVVADGNRIVYSINGHVTTDMTDASPKGKKDGVIGLQLHAGATMTLQFKDIKIKLLPAPK